MILRRFSFPALCLALLPWAWGALAASCTTPEAPGTAGISLAAAGGTPTLAGPADPVSPVTFRNPVIRGMNPDPSVCRVGDDYYLVTSTFEYFPGLPVYHSRDLVHWELIGHALDRDSNAPLTGAASGVGGNYAPTLRHHDGTFYLACTNYGGQGSRGVFYVTATDPAGPWSDPVWMGQWYVDPSLSFEDGIMYWLTPDNNGSFLLGTWDPDRLRWIQPPRKIAAGLGASSPEGPHLYRRDGWWYLMSAEGGTGYQHREVVQRSRSPWGPYEPSPYGDVLSNRKKTRVPFQAIGHADLVELPDGSWWAVCLGIRPVQGTRNHHLGRETFLAPVEWTADGWPVGGNKGLVDGEFPVPPLAPRPWPALPERDDFDAPRLSGVWNFLRNPREEDWSLTERPGFLRLHGSDLTFDTTDSPAFTGQRQTGHRMEATARLEFEPRTDGDEAGLVVRATDTHHMDLAVLRREGRKMAQLRLVQKDKTVIAGTLPLPEGPVILSIQTDPEEYRFLAGGEGREPELVGTGPTRMVSTEVAGGFTGVCLGMYATGNGEMCTVPADFDWFDLVSRGD